MKIIDNGSNNIVNIPDNQDGTIVINGDNNKVIFSDFAFKAQNFLVKIHGNGNIINIERLRRIGSLKLVVQNGGMLTIKEKTSIESAYILCDKSSINIGRDCMILTDVVIRNTDLHGIYSSETGELQNKESSILISDHVWIGTNTLISLDTEVGDNSIICDYSYLKNVTFGEKLMLMGAPAQVVQNNIVWDRRITENLFSEDAIYDQFLKDSFNF